MSSAENTESRILVVDDDEVCRELICAVLEDSGYASAMATNGAEAYRLVCENEFRIVISDWQMPNMSGIELCERLRQRCFGDYVYFILLTSLDGKDHLLQGLQAGADDFLTKPCDPYELQMRVRVAERIVSLENRDLIVFSLAKLAEARDPETGAHLERMREYSRLIAYSLAATGKYAGLVDADFIRAIYLTSPLHDIGKVGIPDDILLKPGKLTAEEFEVMKQHAIIGGNTLDAAYMACPKAEYLRLARDIACTHHEKFDGTGYPKGLKGEEIPLCGRIVALADVYDALTTKRIYKEAFSHEAARQIILESSGKHFDPDIVQAFLQQERRFVEIKECLDFAQSDGPCAIPPLPQVAASVQIAASV